MDEDDVLGLDWTEEDLQEELAAASPLKPHCTFLTGVAGTGKTYTVRERIAADPSWAMLTSTTGISAVNLGCATVNAVLGYFDEASLRDAYLNGQLERRLRGLLDAGYANLLIEECSMLTGTSLDLIYRAAVRVGETPSAAKAGHALGIALVGDVCQLPPVKGSWCFEAECWPEFERGTTRLMKIWRQDASQWAFVQALNYARAGKGDDAALVLSHAGVQWHSALDTEWDGTTIVPTNAQVSRFNEISLARVKGREFLLTAARWGKQRTEWGLNARTKEWGVPERMTLKQGAYVMLLANQRAEDADGGGKVTFEYVNGDCGHVEDWDAAQRTLKIRLVRDGGRVVCVREVVRNVTQLEPPDGKGAKDFTRGDGGYCPRPHRVKDGYVLGQIKYWPVRLAYASTVHKSQGLSLDRAQVDFRHEFFGSPAMLYVAMSRCRTLEGLRLVGQRERFVLRCKCDGKVGRWL